MHILERAIYKICERKKYKILERMIYVKLYGLFASCPKFAKYIGKIQHQTIYTFFIQVLKEQYGSAHIALDSNFSNDAQNTISVCIYIYIYIYIYMYNIII